HGLSLGPAAPVVIVGIGTGGFSVYASNFGAFTRTYGSLAGIIVFLVWLWLANMAVLSGARLDAEVLRLRQLRDGLPAEEAISVTPRATSALAGQARRRAAMLAEFAEIRRLPEARRGGAGGGGTGGGGRGGGWGGPGAPPR